MPRPKGCTCGTPKPCKIHPAVTNAPEGEHPGGGSQGDVDAAPFLRVIEQETEAGRPKSSGSGDPKPKSRSRRKPRTKPVEPDAPDDAALVEMLSQLLTMPAIPAAMLLHCDYCRDHFITEGPKAARELVALSMTNPALRGALESIYSGFAKLTIAGVLAGYALKPMLHHVAPEPVLNAAGPVLGVPPRPEKPKDDHKHAADQTTEHEGHETEYVGPIAEDQHPGNQTAGIYAA